MFEQRKTRTCGLRPALAGVGGILFAMAAYCAPAAAGGAGLVSSETLDTQAAAPAPAAAPAAADQNLSDIDLLQMKIPTVVTATRHEEQTETVPYAISVITADDIRWSGARTVPDALRLVPGVDVAALSSGNAAVSPRGLNGLVTRHVLVLVDGRQVFDSFFGGTLWGSWPFQVEDIDRIEVIRGPGGVTWGANAMNGVINIITKDPAKQQGVTSLSSGGSRGTWQQYGGYGFTDGKLRMRVSGQYDATDGFAKGGSWLRSLDDYDRAGRGSFYATYDATKQDTVTLSGGSNVHEGGDPPMPTAGLFTQRTPGGDSEFFLSKWDHKIASDNQYDVTAYVNDFRGCPGVRFIDYRYQQIALQFSHTFKPTENHTLTWGMDSRTDLLDTSASKPFTTTRDFMSTAIVGLYLQDQWRFAPKWRLDVGGRMDYEFYGGFQPSARTSLSYDISRDSTVYGAVSRAFQMPAVGLRFLDIPVLNGLVQATGSEDLQSMGLVAYEIGHHTKLFDRLEANSTVFWHEYSDMATLSPELGPPGLVRMNQINDSSASTYGFELGTRYKATRNLTFLGNYTFEQLNWRSSVPYVQMDCISPPAHKFMLGTQYSPVKRLRLSEYLYYVDTVDAPNPANPLAPRHVPTHFRLDLRAEYEIWKDRAFLAVGVSDLLDANHYEGGTMFLNDAQVPRMIYAQLRMTFR